METLRPDDDFGREKVIRPRVRSADIAPGEVKAGDRFRLDLKSLDTFTRKGLGMTLGYKLYQTVGNALERGLDCIDVVSVQNDNATFCTATETYSEESAGEAQMFSANIAEMLAFCEGASAARYLAQQQVLRQQGGTSDAVQDLLQRT
jgi:hypothetical protein